MAQDSHKMVLVWRAIKSFDIDKNGFLQADELEGCFREYFAPELDGKSLIYYFRGSSTDHDKELINYRLIKDSIIQKVAQFVPSSPSRSKKFSGTITEEQFKDLLPEAAKTTGLASGGNKTWRVNAALTQSGLANQMVNDAKLPKLSDFNLGNINILNQITEKKLLSMNQGMVTPDRRS